MFWWFVIIEVLFYILFSLKKSFEYQFHREIAKVSWSYFVFMVLVSYRMSIPTYKHQVKISCRACIYTLPCALRLRTLPPSWGGFRRCHASYGSGLHLSVEVGSATTCPVAPDLSSRLRWALALLCVIWLRTSPSSWGGLRRCHISCGSGPHLLAGAGSDAATCPTAPCGPQVSSTKKSLADLRVQLGTLVLNARAHVFRTPHVRSIMCL
jgi:hypothetical protein